MGKYSRADIVDGERITSNGMIAGFVMVDGKRKFRIIGAAPGNDAAQARSRSAKKARPGTRRQISPRSAMRGFNKYYKEKKYKRKSARKGARTRDLCWDNQPSSSDMRYYRSPNRWDYAGVDDGSRCPSGPRRYKKSPKGRLVKGSPEARAWARKMRAAKDAKKAKQSKKGGSRPVSLRTAVKLLRQYYEEKYN